MFDFKKEYKEFYLPKNVPSLVTVPAANFLAVSGKGDPNEPDGAYQAALAKLYAVAYTLKMSYKTDYRIKGFYEYVVPPLEGFWDTGGGFPQEKARLRRCRVPADHRGALRTDPAHRQLRRRARDDRAHGAVHAGERVSDRL